MSYTPTTVFPSIGYASVQCKTGYRAIFQLAITDDAGVGNLAGDFTNVVLQITTGTNSTVIVSVDSWTNIGYVNWGSKTHGSGVDYAAIHKHGDHFDIDIPATQMNLTARSYTFTLLGKKNVTTDYFSLVSGTIDVMR